MKAMKHNIIYIAMSLVAALSLATACNDQLFLEEQPKTIYTVDNAFAKSSQVDAHGLKPDTDDRIVTLSTCTGDESTRFIAQGVLRQIYLSR